MPTAEINVSANTQNMSIKLDPIQEANVFSYKTPKVSIFTLKSSVFLEGDLVCNEIADFKTNEVLSNCDSESRNHTIKD